MDKKLSRFSLEDPLLVVVGVLDNALREPTACKIRKIIAKYANGEWSLQLDFLLSIFDGVGTVADVATSGKGKVPTDGSCKTIRLD